MAICPGETAYGAWCPFCYENAKGRSAHAGHVGYQGRRRLQVENLAMAIKKRDTGVSNGDVVSRVSPGKFGKDYPVLWEFLTLSKYDDGSARILPTLTLFIDTACVKLCLNDRDQGLTGWAASETVEGAFLCLERHLKEDKVDWKLASQPGKGKKR